MECKSMEFPLNGMASPGKTDFSPGIVKTGNSRRQELLRKSQGLLAQPGNSASRVLPPTPRAIMGGSKRREAGEPPTKRIKVTFRNPGGSAQDADAAAAVVAKREEETQQIPAAAEVMEIMDEFCDTVLPVVNQLEQVWMSSLRSEILREC